jgi:hypothetical protein
MILIVRATNCLKPAKLLANDDNLRDLYAELVVRLNFGEAQISKTLT